VALTGQKKGWQVLGQIVGCPLYGREPSRSNWDVGGEGGGRRMGAGQHRHGRPAALERGRRG
jgi:hypothetical protein